MLRCFPNLEELYAVCPDHHVAYEDAKRPLNGWGAFAQGLVLDVSDDALKKRARIVGLFQTELQNLREELLEVWAARGELNVPQMRLIPWE